jgi:hypothetical protein
MAYHPGCRYAAFIPCLINTPKTLRPPLCTRAVQANSRFRSLGTWDMQFGALDLFVFHGGLILQAEHGGSSHVLHNWCSAPWALDSARPAYLCQEGVLFDVWGHSAFACVEMGPDPGLAAHQSRSLVEVRQGVGGNAPVYMSMETPCTSGCPSYRTS